MLPHEPTLLAVFGPWKAHVSRVCVRSGWWWLVASGVWRWGGFGARGYPKLNSTMKFTALLFALALGSASAFTSGRVPVAATRVSKANTLKMVVEEELGVTRPLGLWDPQNFIEREPEKFARRRAVERKHGRIAMAAMTGLIVHNAGIEFPGYLSKTENVKFSDVRDGIYGLLDVPPLGLAQIIIFIGVIETVIWDGFNYSGDYGTGYFGQKLEGEKKVEKLNIELNNGRAAMVGILGAMADEFITGENLHDKIAAGHWPL